MELSEKDAIRQRVDLVEFISRYTALKRSGRTFKGLCPFHNEKTPSFTVDPDRGSWHCWGGCSTGGDIFAFVMKAESLTFPEAAERLASIAGVTLTYKGGQDPSEAARQRDEKERLYSANAEATRFFRNFLGKAKLAQDYIVERGLAHETLENFQVGYAPDEWSALSRYLQGRGVSMDDAEQAGLNFPSRRIQGEFTDKFRGRLIFPIIDVQERVVAFGGRIIPNPELPPDTNVGPKYLNSPETPVFSKSRILYGLNRARKAISDADRVLVVEGYMDVIAAHQAGIENVVATLGTSLTDEHIRILGRYTKNILLSFDSDEAGVRAALRAAELFTAHGPEFALRILAMPEGDDPDSMLRRGNIAGFRKAMDSARGVPEFRIDGLKRHFDLTDEQGRMNYLREAVPILAEVRSSLELDLLVRRLAPQHPSFGSGTRAEASILAEVQRWRSQRPGSVSPQSGDVLTPTPPRPRYERGAGNGSGNGGWQKNNNSGSGNGWQQRSRYNQPPPRPEAPLAPPTSAIEKAERAVLRGLLTDEWRPLVLRELDRAAQALACLPSELLAHPQTQRLVDALYPLLVGRVSLQRALDQLADQELAFFASHYTISTSGDAPLSEQALRDCIHELVLKHPPQNIRLIQEKLAGGISLTNEEMMDLTAWTRAKKRVGEASP
ncbi:DNA primase [Armatimonas sp.]|uniref:DNA primase n=1 Tax=Armatimonas sp. TaxID=1872638 RepID=UPI00286A28BB|nr:DNA primase [Armatimonas sp.]